MNVVIIPGYGDRTDYIKQITASWKKRFGLDVFIHPFGTTDLAETYPGHWQKTIRLLEELKHSAIIGISFGGGIALRAIQERPDLVSKIVCVSAPHRLSDMNPETVRNKYPMLNYSLSAVDPDNLPVGKIMTIRPLKDGVLDPSKVVIKGAKNLQIPVAGHGLGISAALLFKARTITKFIKEKS